MGLSNLFGLIQKSSFKIALRIPRIKLPKLVLPTLLVFSLPKIGVPNFSIIGKAAEIGGGLLSSLSVFQQKLGSMFQSISNLSPGSAEGFVKNILNSATEQFKNLAGNLLKNALNGATAAINGIFSTITTIESSIQNEINAVKNLFSTQTKNVKELLTKEIEVSSGNANTLKSISNVTSVIQKSLTDATKNLPNLTLKTLNENPDKFNEFVNNATQNAINEATKTVVAKNSAINNEIMQTDTVSNLGSEPIVPADYVDTLTLTVV